MRISVVVPASRRAGYLKQTLASVAAQTRTADEVIVSQDGAEPDVSRVIAEANVRSLINDPPLGQLRNRQRAIRAATGDAIAMLDDDDLWEPEFLAEASNVLENHPACAFASADHWLIDSSGQRLNEETDRASRTFGRAALAPGIHTDVLERTLHTMPFPLQFTLFRRRDLEDIGFFPEDAGSTPDFALMLALGAAGKAGFYLPRRLGSYRVHPGQQTALSRVENSESRASTLAMFAAGQAGKTPLFRRRYREAILERSISLAHEGQRAAALRSLGELREAGVGLLSPQRLAVLAALLAGVSR